MDVKSPMSVGMVPFMTLSVRVRTSKASAFAISIGIVPLIELLAAARKTKKIYYVS